MTSPEIKKGIDNGQIIISKSGTPICTVHGDSLWIEEKNLADNSAFCMSSDKTIYCAEGVTLSKDHLTDKTVPHHLDKLAGEFHQ
jgi:hypothetical protein